MKKLLVSIVILLGIIVGIYNLGKIFLLVRSVPEVIWAAITASLLTLGGVLVTNRGNYKRLSEQLFHDASQRDKERKMELRRQVYLEAAEAITANYLIINKLPDLSITDSYLSKQFSDSAASISKVNIIGSDDTVKAVSELSTIIATKYLQLTVKRIPLLQRQQEINVQNGLLTRSAAERDRMIELMKEFNLKGMGDKRLWEVINKNFEFEQKRCNEYISKINELQKIINQEQIQLSLECFEASKEVSEYFIPAVSAIRKEMDIPFDERAYRELLQKSWQVGKDSVQEFINKITIKGG